MLRTEAKNSNSKNILSYGWEPRSMHEQQVGTLQVEFSGRNGVSTVYDYANVPYTKWIGLTHADSAGAYLNSEIKPNYEAKKVQ